MVFKLPDFQYFGYEIKEWWERLAIRKWINQNPRIVVGIAMASVVILLVIVIWLSIPEKVVVVQEYEKEWFYDLNTGKLFVARSGQIPPVEAPSGPLPDGKKAGVRACVLSYTDEPNEGERFIGFLEMADPNAQKSAAASTETAGKRWGRGMLIRRVGDKRWVPADSDWGRYIVREVFRPNEMGERARYFQPE